MNLNEISLNINLSHRAMMGICAGLACLVCFSSVYSLWQWRSDWLLSHQSPPPLALANPNEFNDIIASIPDSHIFGKSPTKMPISNLQMQVTGIVKMPEESGLPSKAYISIEGQPSKIYKVGDDLPYGVKVHDITAHEVIVENEGEFEKLPLPREKLEFKPRKTEEN
jgi:hypothetical protein